MATKVERRATQTEQVINAIKAVELADETGDLRKRSEARQAALRTFSDCPLVAAQPWERLTAYISDHRETLAAQALQSAWETLAERLRKLATKHTEIVRRFIDSATETVVAHEERLLSPFEWSLDAFEAAAMADVAREIAARVDFLSKEGQGAAENFKQLEISLNESIRVACRSSLHRSTSPTANLAASAKAIAWGKLSDRSVEFRMGWSI